MAKRYDIVVIGSGPGGEGAAMQAAKAKKSVTVVERYNSVGGGCTHWGTIPSKALRHSIQELTEVWKNPLLYPFLQQATRSSKISFPDMLRSAASVIQNQVDMRRGFYERNLVAITQGEATFTDPHTIAVHRPNGEVEEIESDYFIIATGSSPYRPPDVDFGHDNIYDADTILQMAQTPRSLLVYGAGVIGCEYASMFRNFGLKVDLINTRDRLLSYLDDEIIDALAYHLRDQGVRIHNSETYQTVSRHEDGRVALKLNSGKVFHAGALLWANGRTGSTKDLGLQSIGLEVDSRGNLTVDDNYQTAHSHIYAVGDVVGFPALASTAYDQGRFAATHIVADRESRSLLELLPTGIYTSPEISFVGKTERELTAEQVPYEVGQAGFKSLARAQITGQTVGMLKLLFHRDTLQLLGVHCFGYQAAEIVHIGQAVMAQKDGANTVEFFINTTFNYPTMAEAYRVAALNGLNRLA